MSNFVIRIANTNIEINSIYSDIETLCKEYIVDSDSIDFSVSCSNDDIEYERQKSIREAMYEHLPIYDYKDGYLETLSIYRKIALEMVNRSTCVFHGAAIALNNEGYLFTAKSGTGKTTHINLWQKLYKDVYVVNGDKPLLKIEEDKVFVCGTPWAGKEGLNTNTIVPLKAICILQRDKTNHIEKITSKDAFDMLMQQIYRPNDSEGIKKTIALASKLSKIVPIYRLGCNMEDEAAIVSYEGMK